MEDKIHKAMEDRFMSLNKLGSSFGFPLDMKELICTARDNSLKQRCTFMGSISDVDLDGLEVFSDKTAECYSKHQRIVATPNVSFEKSPF